MKCYIVKLFRNNKKCEIIFVFLSTFIAIIAVLLFKIIFIVKHIQGKRNFIERYTFKLSLTFPRRVYEDPVESISDYIHSSVGYSAKTQFDINVTNGKSNTNY